MTARAFGLLLLAIAVASGPAAAATQDVSLDTPTGTLFGTLQTPGEQTGAGPAVLLLAGSGPTDRDGNQPGLHTGVLRQLALALSRCGIATLRTDKRGIAASHAAGQDEDLLTIETYRDDAVAWLGWLRARPGVSSVAAIGHSEGALIATMAAQRTMLRRLVLAEGAGRPAGQALREQLASRLVSSPALLRRAEAAITRLEHGLPVEFPPPALAALFRPSVQPYLISWFALDPVHELAATGQPTLVVQGSTDLQVPPADAARLAAARPGIELATFAGMNHVLRPAPSDWDANIATYSQPDAPLMPGLAERLCRFLA